MLRSLILASALTVSISTMAAYGQEASSMVQADVFAPETVRGWVADYFAGTRSMDAAIWASAFADDAILDDPVGSPLKTTPEAILAQGEGFVGAFETIGLHEDFVHVVGNEAVAKWEGRGVTPDGTEVTFEGINVFTFNENGKIAKLRGFFSHPGE